MILFLSLHRTCRINKAEWKKMGRKSITKNKKSRRFKNKCKSFAGFSDLIDEVVGLGINKRFGAPFGDGGTLLHELSKNSNLKILLNEYWHQN